MKKVTTLFICMFFSSSQAFSAWTSVGSLAAKAHAVSADPFTFTTSATLEANNVGVCVLAVDNDGDGTDTNDFSGVTDSAGNLWVNAGMNERDPGAGAAGAAVAIYYTIATTQLNSGGTITVDLPAARTGKGAACWEFSVGGTARSISKVGVEQKEDVNTDAASLTLGSLVNREHLWIRGVASETTNPAITTQTSSWTIITSSGTNTGTEATSMGAGGEFFIASATTQSSDPTMTDTSADRASSLIALDEDAIISDRFRRRSSTSRE